MKASSAPSSAITLADFAGLIKDLIDKLTGKKARFWLNSFKRFLRKENPWPPVRTLFANKKRFQLFANLKDVLKGLEEVKFHMSDLDRVNFDSLPESNYLAKELGCDDFEYSVVGIRVADLLTPSERLFMTYNEMLAKAETLGFYPCDVFSGLVGVVSLIADQLHSSSGQSLNFVICSHSFVDADKFTQRLYQGIIWAGEKSPNGRGDMFLRAIGPTLTDPALRFEFNLDCLMLFISVTE